MLDGIKTAYKSLRRVARCKNEEDKSRPSRTPSRKLKIKVERKWYTPTSTVGELSINGFLFCHTLEDKDRKLEDAPSHAMMSRKLPGETAIPRGTYKLGITDSPRFGRRLPLLYDVPCFTGIRIHGGNDHGDTEGCLLVGDKRTKDDYIYNSRVTLERLIERLDDAIESGEGLEIEIV